MKFKLLFFLILFSTNLFAQAQQQPTKYSVDDVMKKLEAMDNSIKENVNSLRNEFDQKLSQSVNQIRNELSLKIERIDSKVSTLSSSTEQIEKRINKVEAQNRDLRNQITKFDERLSAVGNEIGDVKRSVGEVNAGVKEVSSKIDENTAKFDQVISKVTANRATLIVGFIIVIVLSAGIAVGLSNLSKLTKSVEKNILDSFESTAGKIEVTTNDLKTLADVIKQQTSEVSAYQRILEERIISAQQQLEAKLEEKLAPRRRTQRKSAKSEE